MNSTARYQNRSDDWNVGGIVSWLRRGYRLADELICQSQPIIDTFRTFSYACKLIQERTKQKMYNNEHFDSLIIEMW